MIYDKYFFVIVNFVIFITLFVLIFFFRTKKISFVVMLLFIFLQTYNVYFFISNSERITYNKIRYDDSLNKSSFSELNYEMKDIELIIKNALEELKQSNNLSSFYSTILNSANFFENKYFQKKNELSKVASIVSVTSNLYPFASKNAIFFKGNGICINNLNHRQFRDKLKFAKYACCGDYCYITSNVLNMAGFKSRYIFTKQHLLLEVLLDEKWILVDPTFGIIYDQSYFYNKNYNVLLLPNLGLLSNSENYRASFFIARNYMLYIALNYSLKNSLYKSTVNFDKFDTQYLLN